MTTTPHPLTRRTRTTGGPPADGTRRRALVAWSLGAAGLAGCSITPKPPAPPALFDLGPAPSFTAGPGPALRLFDVTTHAALDGTGIGYRLDYRDTFRREVYRDSRWVAPPAVLLTQRLRQRFASFAAPPRPTAGTAAPAEPVEPLVLQVQLDEFFQVFSSPTSSRAVLVARATLGGPGARRWATPRLFVVTRDAPSPDAAGAVRGLAAAADEWVEQIVTWAREP